MVTTRYKIGSKLGHGAYGVVRSAIDRQNNDTEVAIKMISISKTNTEDTARIVREIKLLQHFNHYNLVKMVEFVVCTDHIHIVFEKMDMDMHTMINENDDLTWEHHAAFMLQTLRAINYMHACNVVHRDLKPKNILINTDCALKLADFGLSRTLSSRQDSSDEPWSDYVFSRWYRPPELCGLFFKKTHYSKSADMWAVGCIFAEMILRKPLFPGKNAVDQIEMMMKKLLGKPTPEFIERIENKRTQKFFAKAEPCDPKPFREVFPMATDDEIALLEGLLKFDPLERMTAEQAMELPIFSKLKKDGNKPDETLIAKIANDLDELNEQHRKFDHDMLLKKLQNL